MTVQFQPVEWGRSECDRARRRKRQLQDRDWFPNGNPAGRILCHLFRKRANPIEDDPGTPGGRHITDPKYANAKTSGLKCTVQSGKNEFNIPLQKPPKTAPRTGA